MILADKIKIILDLQCKHSNGLASFDKSLSFGLCVEERLKANIQTMYLIRTLYRYNAFDAEVTNAQVIVVDSIVNPLDTYSITLGVGGVTIATYTGTGTMEAVLNELVTTVNEGTSTHNYMALVDGNLLYLYTYSQSATFSDPLVTDNAVNGIGLELGQHNAVTGEDLHLLLDLNNCLTLSEVCAIVTEVRRLLGDCNC